MVLVRGVSAGVAVFGRPGGGGFGEVGIGVGKAGVCWAACCGSGGFGEVDKGTGEAGECLVVGGFCGAVGGGLECTVCV